MIYTSCSTALSQNSNGNPASFSIALMFASAVLIFYSGGPFWCDDAIVVTSNLVPDLYSQIAWISSGALSVLALIILSPVASSTSAFHIFISVIASLLYLNGIIQLTLV
jgi:hypothetical protein